jgi:hypothetical protein
MADVGEPFPIGSRREIISDPNRSPKLSPTFISLCALFCTSTGKKPPPNIEDVDAEEGDDDEPLREDAELPDVSPTTSWRKAGRSGNGEGVMSSASLLSSEADWFAGRLSVEKEDREEEGDLRSLPAVERGVSVGAISPKGLKEGIRLGIASKSR